ncbi:MAG TPA: bi-domain-containing oxidoreductase [Planctomycetota bacterium]|nr:bi-domain-containing oxidoreductase [Planctomycetota bacterium]
MPPPESPGDREDRTILQVTHNPLRGRITVSRVPPPACRAGHVLIANACSVLSPGTERAALELGRKSLLGKARERPDQVARLLEKIRTEGLRPALSQAFDRLDQPSPLGYSSAGVAIACGEGVPGIRPGMRVASNGPHAGLVCVPRNLCAPVPENVPLDHAAYAVIGAIALQGVRLSRVELGDSVYVIGLGLVGQLAVALLKASGCRVYGTDLDPWKCEVARSLGADRAAADLDAAAVQTLTGGLGADAVLVTASTPSDGPIEQAAAAVRPKGRVVAVGAVGLNVPRRPFYFKEAELVVSKSYGPGRYDPEYEDRGRDYPPAYVRWTEQRNIQAVLDLMAAGRLDVSPLTTHRFPIERAEEAYALLEKGSARSLGVLLEYPAPPEAPAPPRHLPLRAAPSSKAPAVGFLGAGQFARAVLLPTLRSLGSLRFKTLCSPGPLAAIDAADKFGFESVTTDEDALFADPEIKAIFIATRHDQHARLAIRALRAGKHVFVEKPLGIALEEIESVERALAEAPSPPPLLMVGFNRRFSPLSRAVREFFADTATPRTVSVRFNAGTLPPGHWAADDAIGGGRIVGEACHGIDLATYLVGAPPARVFAEAVPGADDRCFITLRHTDGSVSCVAYLSGGDRGIPKERVEVFGGGRVAVIDDFREACFSVEGRIRRQRRWRRDKGHRDELAAFAELILRGGEAPVSWPELRAVSLTALLAVRSLREGVPLDIA